MRIIRFFILIMIFASICGCFDEKEAPTEANIFEFIKIEVLNGTNETGAAKRYTDHIRDLGADVINYGNTDYSQYSNTIIIDRTGKLNNAFLTAKKLNIDKKNVIQQIDETLVDIDITIIIGSDYKELIHRNTSDIKY